MRYLTSCTRLNLTIEFHPFRNLIYTKTTYNTETKNIYNNIKTFLPPVALRNISRPFIDTKNLMPCDKGGKSNDFLTYYLLWIHIFYHIIFFFSLWASLLIFMLFLLKVKLLLFMDEREDKKLI